jgi:hypothetical protein
MRWYKYIVCALAQFVGACQLAHRSSIFKMMPLLTMYRGADKSLARPGRKQITATEDFDFHISYL